MYSFSYKNVEEGKKYRIYTVFTLFCRTNLRKKEIPNSFTGFKIYIFGTALLLPEMQPLPGLYIKQNLYLGRNLRENYFHQFLRRLITCLIIQKHSHISKTQLLELSGGFSSKFFLLLSLSFSYSSSHFQLKLRQFPLAP